MSEDTPVLDGCLEALAYLEHEQWVYWTKIIAEEESISPERLARWRRSWVPYWELPESEKEFDRFWGRKVRDTVELFFPFRVFRNGDLRG